jgi:hypothetical protein
LRHKRWVDLLGDLPFIARAQIGMEVAFGRCLWRRLP